ncbi:MAG: glycoside hydrolase family 13 protein, partial [Halanaerobiales bacterium]
MDRKWWKEGVVYQIYPRSFNDSNGDGIGDLNGIREKLGYLKDLGVDIIWLCPVYESPNDDNGYDISNYYDIMDEFGTLEDMDRLIAEAHQMGLKIIMDLVVNHSSDEHPWFIKSRSSKDNPYRDFYIWRKGKGDQPPNNWGSYFGGSAWEYDEESGEYYLHLFSKKQPDLNWENPELRKKVYKMMRWWLDKGIDGFRMDTINMLSKTSGLPDAKDLDGRYSFSGEHWLNGPAIHQYLHEMYEEVLSDYDIMTVGETPGVSAETGLKYVAFDRKELDMLIHFELMDIDSGKNKWERKNFALKDFKKIFTKWNKELENRGWICNYLNNHDQPRVVSRFGNDREYREESAKMLATLLLTMPGTPFVYQGEEIGMTNVTFEKIDEYRDIETMNFYQKKMADGESRDKVMDIIHKRSRDNARTPMQWNDNKNAGFTEGTPWIKVNPNYKMINVKRALADKGSIYWYYHKLLRLRKFYKELFVYAKYCPILPGHQKTFAYLRLFNEEKMLVILNFSSGESIFILPDNIEYDEKELLL